MNLKDYIASIPDFPTKGILFRDITPLLQNSEVFDVYTGQGIENGKKSLAYSLTFGANDRTLTDEEINIILDKIVNALNKIGDVRGAN